MKRHSESAKLSAACALAASMGILAVSSPRALGAQTTWIGPGDGDWAVDSNWSSGATPQPVDDVYIDGGSAQASTVHLTTSASINTLTISPDDRLVTGNAAGGSALQIAGTSIVNAGTLDVGVGGIQSTQIVPTGSSLTLSGGGTVNMLFAQIRGPGRLINVDNTIRTAASSFCVFSPGMLNSGTILSSTANYNTTFFSDTNVPMQNRGVLHASDGGLLTLTGQLGRIFDNAGGVISSDPYTGGAIQLDSGATVIGGTFGPGNCLIQPYTSGTIQDLSNQSLWLIDGALDLVGTIQNTGQFLTESRLNVDGVVTLRGNGYLTAEVAGRIGGSGKLINESNQIIGVGYLGDNAIAIENRAGGLIASRLGYKSSTFVVDPKAGSVLLNEGVLRADQGTLVLSGYGGGSFTNTGTIEAINGGTVVFADGAELSNYSAGRLTGGYYYVSPNSTLDIAGASIDTNAASIRIEGAASRFAALDSLSRNDGTILLAKQRDLSLASRLVNSGWLSLDGGSDLNVAADFTQAPSGTLRLQLNGTADESYGQVHAGGAVTLSGALVVDGSIDPPLLAEFVLISGQSISGMFDSVLLPPPGSKKSWQLQYRSDSVVLRAVPEPSAGVGAILWLIASGRRRRRRKQSRTSACVSIH